MTASEPRFECPVPWCNGRADAHDLKDPRVGEHIIHVVESSAVVGDIGVYVTTTRDDAGELVHGPALVLCNLSRPPGWTTLEGRIIAKALELAVLMAEAIDAGEWSTS